MDFVSTDSRLSQLNEVGSLRKETSYWGEIGRLTDLDPHFRMVKDVL